MVFHWKLSDSQSPQVYRTLISILTNLNSTVVWMVFTCAFISNSSRPFTNLLVTILRVPITVGITITFMFHSFFSSLARSKYLFLFSLSFNFTLCFAGTVKSATCQILFFLLTITRPGHLAKILLSMLLFFVYILFFLNIFFKVCIYPALPLEQDVTQGQFFKAEFNWFEFRIFHLQDRLLYQG